MVVFRDLIRSLIVLCTEGEHGHKPFVLSVPLWRASLQGHGDGKADEMAQAAL